MRLRIAALTLAVCGMLSGCAQPESEAGWGAPTPVDDLPAQRANARAALERWDDAVAAAGDRLGVVWPSGNGGEWTAVVGTWDGAYGENAKPALGAGLVEAAGALPTAAPAGEVRWRDGRTRAMRVLPAADALRAIRDTATDGPCATCTPLRVTAARPTTVAITTLDGEADAPAWEFTLAGTSARLTRVAVAADAIVPLTPPPWASPPGLSIETATAQPDARRLTVGFTGSPGTRARPCGADYTTEVVESARAVVVIVVEHRHAADEACLLIGAPRTAEAVLAAPLADRAVLDARYGLPVPVSRAARAAR
jgi:hypothetical protein